MRRIYSVISFTTFTALLFVFSFNIHNSTAVPKGYQLHKIKVENKAMVVLSVGLFGLAVVELNEYLNSRDSGSDKIFFAGSELK